MKANKARILPADLLRLVRHRFPPDDPVRKLVESWPAEMSLEEARIRAADLLAILEG